MKLKINKACDMSSISVLPPHERRPNPNPITGGADSSSLGRSQSTQLRSQSQQSFSQGMSLTQLSQSSFDEALTNEPRFGSQERDLSTKRISYLAPITSAREDSQMQLSRSSNNVIRRWNPSCAPDQRCQVSEELDRRIGSMEASLNRMGRIMDSVQSDVMQVHKAVKEVSLETEGIRQKMIFQDNSMQLMLKGEEDIKGSLERNLKPNPDQLIKECNLQKLPEIASALAALPDYIESRLLRLQRELCGDFTKKMEAMASGSKSVITNQPISVQAYARRSCTAMRSQMNQPATTEIPFAPPKCPIRQPTVLDIEAENLKPLKPKLSSFMDKKPKKEEIPLAKQAQEFRVVIESDDEYDGGFTCLLEEKETGWASSLSEEAREESLRILRKARRRKRKFSNTIILV